MLLEILFLVLSTSLFSSKSLVFALKIMGSVGGLDARTRKLPSRVEIDELAASGPAFDLYILALQKFQDTDQTNQLSYFQIAGIHGYPKVPWDGVSGKGQQAGYCMHGAVTFPIWHRPYLALFEVGNTKPNVEGISSLFHHPGIGQVLWSHARFIADTYPSDQLMRYQAAASTLRLPYWDWASHSSLPVVTTSPTIFINSPVGWREVRNPLYRYDFHPGPEGNQFPPENPNLPFRDLSVAGHDNAMLNRGGNKICQLSSASYTTRHADSQHLSDQNAATDEMKSHEANTLALTYQLLTTPSNYSQFSCTSPGGNWNGANNIESIHNGIHNWIGGAHGSMTWPEFAAFDPIFWLHHAQVDRVFALWQALNPANYIVPQQNTIGSYYEPAGTIESTNTVLAPFHSDAGATMFTPERARNISLLGYTYPELTNLNGSRVEQVAELKRRINKLYNQNAGSTSRVAARTTSKQAQSLAQAFSRVNFHTAQEIGINNLDIQWSINVRVNRFAYNTSFAIDFFMGPAPIDVAQWPTSANLIGTFSQFRAANTTARTSLIMAATEQHGEVSLTPSLAAGVWRGFLPNLTSEVVVPLLQRNLAWKARTQYHQEICLGDLSGLLIVVQSRAVKPSRNASEFPRYGRYISHPAATVGREGGN